MPLATARYFGQPANLFRHARRFLQALYGPARRPARRRARSLSFEDLEERAVLSTLAVVNVLDAGPGSLRQAILDANSSPGQDTIRFQIGTGVKTIQPTSPLPTLTGPVIIDGTTQPGYTTKPIIELDGTLAGLTANGLTIAGGNSTVRGLVINRFGGNGIEVDANGNNVIQNNYVGTDVTGTLARGNGGYGIALDNALLNTVGGTTAGTGNVISGNGLAGVYVTGNAALLVTGSNGVNVVDQQSGAVLATYATGYQVTAAIFGPDGTVYLLDSLGNQVLHYDAAGNFLSSFGTASLSNPRDLAFAPSGNLCVTSANDDVQEFTPTGTYVGQFSDGLAQGMSGIRGIVFGADGNAYETDNGHSKIYRFNGTTGAFIDVFATGSGGFQDLHFGPDGNLYVASATANAIYRFRGTDGAALGAFVSGVTVSDPYGFSFNQAGNLEIPNLGLGQVNTYSGTTGAYLGRLSSGLSSPKNLVQAAGDVIQGNSIGTDAGGSNPLPNQAGIIVSASNTTIGGTAAGAANIIAHNNGTGVEIQAGSGNTIEANAIFANDGVGIDMGGKGIVANTGSKDVTLPNYGMNFPVFTSRTLSGATLTVAGYVGSAPSQTIFAYAHLDIFKSDNDPIGHGQGQIYLGSLTADAGGNFSGTLTVSGLSLGDTITATATDPSGNTSEFAANSSLLAPFLGVTTISASANPSVYGQTVTFTASVIAAFPAVGSPTGTVTFTDGGTTLGTVAVSAGKATFLTSTLIVGSHSIQAKYNGDTQFQVSSSSLPLTENITPAPLTITASAASKVYSQANPAFAVTYSGFVNGETPSSLTGSLTFSTTATASSSVGSYAVTPGGLTSSNYTITTVAGTLSVTPAALSVTATSGSKVYGQANPAFAVTYSGFVNGDTSSALGGSLSYTTTATSASAVGSYAVTPGGLTSSNYTISNVNGTLSVTPASLTVTTVNASKVYGQANPAFAVTYSGFVNGDTPSALGGSLSFTTSASSASAVGSYAVTSGGSTSNNYTISNVNGTLSVTPAALTVTTVNTSKVYGQANPVFAVTYSGFVNGDTSSALGGTLSYTTTATTSSGVGSYAITPGGLTSSNYTISNVNGTLSVTPAALTVTTVNASKVYGQANLAFAVTYSGFVNGDTPSALGGSLTYATAATASSPVGSYAVTPGGLISSNYTITMVAGTLNVTPAALTVTATSASKVYGQANPAFAVTYSGFVNGDTPSALGGSLTYATAATASSPVGSYAVTPGGLISSNYTITMVAGTLNVTPAALTVTAVDASKVYGQANPAFVVTYSGFVNGDTPSALGGSLTFTTVATSASSAGSYAVTPGGLTSTNYSITMVTGTLSITPAALTVTAVDANKVYGQANPAFAVTYSGFVNGDTPSALAGSLGFTSGATSASPVGSYAVTPGGLTSNNYTITNVDGTLSVTPAALTVTAVDASKVYGQANPAFAVTYSGFVNGDTPSALGGSLTYSTAATVSSPVGSYAVTPGGLTSANYTITMVAGALSVTPAALTVTAVDGSKLYGQANPAFAVSYSGFVNGDTPSALTGSLTFGTTATASSSVGSYAVTPGGLTSNNYTITNMDGTLSVTPAALTVTAVNASKVYGQANPAFAVTYSGFVNGDMPSALAGSLGFTTAATSASAVGSYAVTPGGLTSNNYMITMVDGTLSVTPAALTVTAVDASKVYGQANPAFAVTYTGFVNGDTPSALGGSLSFNTAATSASPVGTYAVTPGGLTSNNYTITMVDGMLNVTRAALTVKAIDSSKIYGQANPAFVVTYSGFVNGDTPSALAGTLTFTTVATASSSVGSYAVTPGGLTSSNYTITMVDGTLNVIRAALSVTAIDSSKIYGQANPAFAVTYNGFVNGDTPSALSGTLTFTTVATASSSVGSYAVTPGGLTSSNYTITNVNGKLNVTAAALTVAATDAWKIYGQANPAFAVTYSGFVNGDTPAVLGGSLTFATPASAGSPVGLYAIMPGGLTSNNYTISVVNGTLSIASAALTVTATHATKVYGQANPPFTVTYNGFVNGDTPSALRGRLAFSTIAGAASPVGIYPVAPSGLTSSNYAITMIDGTLAITPAPLTVTALDASRVYGDPNPAFAVAYSGFVNDDTAAALDGSLTFATPATTTSLIGAYPVTPGGLTADNYGIRFVSGRLNVTPTGITPGEGTAGTVVTVATVSTVRTPAVLSADSAALTSNKVDIRSAAIYHASVLPLERLAVVDVLPRIDRPAEDGAGARVRLNASRPVTAFAVAPLDPGSNLPPLGLERPVGPSLRSVPQLAVDAAFPVTLDTWDAVRVETGQLRQEIQADSIHATAWSVSASGALVSAGYVALSGRLSLWVLSLLTARPLMWRGFDPVEVLFSWEEEKRRRAGAKGNADEEETLQSLVK